LAECAISGDGLFRFGTAADARLRCLGRHGDEVGDKISVRPRAFAQDLAVADRSGDRNQSVAQARLLSRNGTLDLSRPRRRKRRATQEFAARMRAPPDRKLPKYLKSAARLRLNPAVCRRRSRTATNKPSSSCGQG